MSIRANIDYKSNYRANLISNIALFLLNVGIGILLPSFFIKTLGVDDYGIVAMGTSLYAYVSIITVSISGSLSRFLMIDMNNDDKEGFNSTFNTAFWTQILVSFFIIVPLFIAFIYYVDKILKIPNGHVEKTQSLFLYMALSFVVLIIAGVFSTVANVYNKIYLKNIADRITLLTYAILAPAFIFLISHSISSIGLAYLLGAVGTLVYSIFIWKKLTPYVTISVKYFKSEKLKQIFTLGGWLIVNQIAAVLFLNMDLFVINKFMDASDVGKYAAIMRWSALIRTLGAVVSGSIGSTLVLLYAQEKTDKLIEVSKKVVKLMAIFLAFPIGIVCCFAKPLLFFWLGSDYVVLYPLMIVITIHLIVNVSTIPLISIFQAYNKAKFPGIVTLVLGVLNLVLSISLIKYTKLGLYGVALAGLIILTVKNLLFTTYYTSHLLKIKNIFMKALLPGLIILFIIGVLSFTINIIFKEFNLMTFCLSVLLVLGISSLIAYKYVFSAEDKNFVFSIILKKKAK